MGISINAYRQVIGSFQFRKQKKVKFISSGWKSSSEANIKSKLRITKPIKLCEIILGLVAWAFILFIVHSDVWNPCKIEKGENIIRNLSTTTGISQNCTPFNLIEMLHNQRGITFSFETNEINKLMHSLHGNRRNLGYKYFVWNCDRAFLSENKIEDIKLLAEQRKPHAFSIIEANIFRDEDNKDLESKTNFSTQQVLDKFQIQDYDIILPDSWKKHNVARIICYVHIDIKVKKVQLNEDESHLQNVLLEVGFGRSTTHYVSMYYREWKSCVHGRRDPASQQEDLQKTIDIWTRCTNSDKDFVSLGDLNLCAKKWDDPSYQHVGLSNMIKDFLISENCCHLINEITRLRQVNDTVQQSALDQIITNCPEKISKPEIIGVGKSDHLGVFITRFSREVRTSPRTTKKRIYKEFDPVKFKQDIINAKRNGAFENMHNQEDVDEAILLFTSAYNSVLDQHAPIKIIQNRNSYVPYISKEIKTLMNERNEMKILSARTGRNEDFNKYKRLRNKVVAKLKKAKSNYYQEKFNDPSLTPKETWKNAYQLLGSSKSSFPNQIIINNTLVSKPINMASGMNNFFLDKIRKLKNENVNQTDFQQASEELVKFLSGKSLQNSFSIRELNDEEMRKLIKSVTGKKSLGLDWICSYSLKIVAEELLPELKLIINLSINSGKFGSQWKLSKVLPGWKMKGSRCDSKFYRPISNLSELSKLCEKAVHDQLYSFLMNNMLIHPNHYGFLKKCSTANALQHAVDLWLQSMDKNKINAALFLDLSAGFDVINLDLLLHKLHLYNFDENTLKWFESYLKGRQQCVQVESAFSPLLGVPFGVPQGSILGPILFLIFINELPEILKSTSENEENNTETDVTDESHIIVFADDNTPTCSETDPNEVIETMQEDSNIVTGWFQKNEMIVSGEKTKLLLISSRANRSGKLSGPARGLNINGDYIEESESEKLLGLLINNTCTWKTHLYGDEENPGLIKQLSQRIGILKRLKKYMPSSKFKQIVSGIYYSKQMYCLTVYGCVWGLPGNMDVNKRNSIMITKEDMRKLQVAQNSVMRLITNSRYDTPTSELLSKSKQLSIHQMMAFYTSCQVFNIHQNQFPTYHYRRFFGEPNPLRSGTNLESRIEFKSSQGRGSFFYNGSRLWNALPHSAKTAPNITTFKKVTKPWVKATISIRP